MIENDFIILNYLENKIMKSILNQLERLNERLENGTELQSPDGKNNE